jgi:hypothetical protein
MAAEPPTPSNRSWFLAGLFCTTLATLALETLDTRLVSALTWYHLSFFAVSMAMFGMAGGAVHVYLGGERYQGDAARKALVRFTLLLAATIPMSHIANLAIPFTIDPSLTAMVGCVLGTLVLALPFYLAGIVVAIALTRIPGAVGITYAVDLLGAALGALLVIPLLTITNLPSAVFLVGAIAAGGALCFARMEGVRTRAPALIGVLVAIAIANTFTQHGFRVLYSKENVLHTESIAHEAWNIHSHVVANQPEPHPPHYWGKGKGAPDIIVDVVDMSIDGSAGTNITRWDGHDLGAIDWVRYDVTSLPYHLRKGGDAAIIGVGGGRDLLTAIWGGSRSVTGIEINAIFVDLLEHRWRDFAGLADRPEVHLVNDEARSWLTRNDQRFDVLQMSLIDTWAATGAGAFTLSENGLYTLDAWRVFLGSLKPTGIFSVSRWYSPEKASETSRLLSLGTAALLERGVADPSQNMMLVARKSVATLLVSPSPFTPEDIDAVMRTAAEYDFTVLLAPGKPSLVPLLGKIAESTSLASLHRTIDHEPLDFSPPTDRRPFFFNMLRPTKIWEGFGSSAGVIVRGNILATMTLLFLFLVAAALVAAVIIGPLWRAGMPAMSRKALTYALTYFASIGMGFMFVQIPLMQRFSVYLGHPTYAIAIILFSMILFAGIGSSVSDRIPVERAPVWLVIVPLAIAVTLVAATASIQPIIDRTIRYDLPVRGLIVVATTAPLALLLGCCFPIGLRLTGRISPEATAWMWGVNGASGVLASVAAVAVSMWAGIDVSLCVAAVLYAALVVSARALWAIAFSAEPA